MKTKRYLQITIIIIALFPFTAYIIHFNNFLDSYAFKIIFNQIRPNRLLLIQNSENSFSITTYLSYFFSLIGLAGVVLNRISLQKIFLAITLNISIAFFFGSLFALLLGEQDGIFIHLPKQFRILALGIHSIWIIVSFIALKYLQNSEVQNLKKDYFTGKSKRLINYLVDGLTIFISTFTIAQLGLSKLLSHDSDVMLVMVTYSIMYYLFFEYFFNCTVGKLTTGTRIFSLNGEAVTFKKVLVRTMVRLIPFEPFSFLLSKNGWHDQLSDTTVQ